MSFIYLASPYSDPDPNVKEIRYQQVMHTFVALVREGKSVYAPILMCHPTSQEYSLPGDWLFWAKFDRPFVEAASALYVLMLPGWEHSAGVREEIAAFKFSDKPIFYVELPA